ncbi:MAG: ATP-binding protein, partial [Rhodospirillaceae bacterium]
EVSDTGVGIPHSEFARVLEPFEQLDNRFNRSRNGTGLGLTLVQGLVALHNGRLDIASTPEQGSTFTVWFPPPPTTLDANGEGT